MSAECVFGCTGDMRQTIGSHDGHFRGTQVANGHPNGTIRSEERWPEAAHEAVCRD
jgi:hypothetical protein